MSRRRLEMSWLIPAVRKAGQGRPFTTTKKERPVVEMILFEADRAAGARVAAEKMIRFMKSGEGRAGVSPTAEQIREWRDEGRLAGFLGVGVQLSSQSKR